MGLIDTLWHRPITWRIVEPEFLARCASCRGVLCFGVVRSQLPASLGGRSRQIEPRLVAWCLALPAGAWPVPTKRRAPRATLFCSVCHTKTLTAAVHRTCCLSHLVMCDVRHTKPLPPCTTRVAQVVLSCAACATRSHCPPCATRGHCVVCHVAAFTEATADLVNCSCRRARTAVPHVAFFALCTSRGHCAVHHTKSRRRVPHWTTCVFLFYAPCATQATAPCPTRAT